MSQIQKGIAQFMKQKNIVKEKAKEDEKQERTAQTILKSSKVPKKNASKEAKNMLNSLTSSIRKTVNEAPAGIGNSPCNSLSPNKSIS